jgi:hypothetical protein
VVRQLVFVTKTVKSGCGRLSLLLCLFGILTSYVRVFAAPETLMRALELLNYLGALNDDVSLFSLSSLNPILSVSPSSLNPFSLCVSLSL